MKQPLDVAKTARCQLVSLATPLKLILLHIAVTTLSRRFQTVLGLKEQRLQGGHDANGTAVVRPGIGLGFRPEIPKQRWVELENDTPNGENDTRRRRRHRRQEPDGKDVRPKQTNPDHCTRLAQNPPGNPAMADHRGRRRHRATPTCRTGTKLSNRHSSRRREVTRRRRPRPNAAPGTVAPAASTTADRTHIARRTLLPGVAHSKDVPHAGRAVAAT